MIIRPFLSSDLTAKSVGHSLRVSGSGNCRDSGVFHSYISCCQNYRLGLDHIHRIFLISGKTYCSDYFSIPLDQVGNGKPINDLYPFILCNFAELAVLTSDNKTECTGEATLP